MRFWMVRAGEGGYLVEEFEKAGCVAIGWGGAGDFTTISSLEEMKERIASSYPENSPQQNSASAGMAWRFRGEISVGDRVTTYDPAAREYLLGTVSGEYRYDRDVLPDYNHIRPVQWESRVSRDSLSKIARNSLGSIMTLFEPADGVLDELEAAAQNDRLLPAASEQDDEADLIRADVVSRAHEFIKDKILALSPSDMEELTAGILRAMGYRARSNSPWSRPWARRDSLSRRPWLPGAADHRRGQAPPASHRCGCASKLLGWTATRRSRALRLDGRFHQRSQV